MTRYHYVFDPDNPDPYLIYKCPNCGHEQKETEWIRGMPMNIDAKCSNCKKHFLHDCKTRASDLIFVKHTRTLKQKLDGVKFIHELEKGD